MHTCEIVVRNYGMDEGDYCGKPATKSVVKSECPNRLLWLCDEHYEHASRNWDPACCEF